MIYAAYLIIVMFILLILLLIYESKKNRIELFKLKPTTDSDYNRYKNDKRLIKDYTAEELLSEYKTMEIKIDPSNNQLYLKGPDGPIGDIGLQGPNGHLIFKNEETITSEYCPLFPEVGQKPENCPDKNEFQIIIDNGMKGNEISDKSFEKLKTECTNSFMSSFGFKNVSENIAIDTDCKKIDKLSLPIYVEENRLSF